MAHSRVRRGADMQVQADTIPAQQPAVNAGKNVQPWHELAREAAQIIVSALALYASAKGFIKKIRERGEEV